MKIVKTKRNLILIKILTSLFLIMASFLLLSCNKNVVEENIIEETKSLAEELGVDINDYKFILANIDNSIGDYTPELVEIENGRKFD